MNRETVKTLSHDQRFRYAVSFCYKLFMDGHIVENAKYISCEYYNLLDEQREVFAEVVKRIANAKGLCCMCEAANINLDGVKQCHRGFVSHGYGINYDAYWLDVRDLPERKIKTCNSHYFWRLTHLKEEFIYDGN